MNECTLSIVFWMRGPWKDLLPAVGQSGDRISQLKIRGHSKHFPKPIGAYPWPHCEWLEKSDLEGARGFLKPLLTHQQLCSLNYGYLHKFWVCRQNGSKTILRFSLVQPPTGIWLWAGYLTHSSDWEASVPGGAPRSLQCANDFDIRKTGRCCKRPRVPWEVTWEGWPLWLGSMGKERHMAEEIALTQDPRCYGGHRRHARIFSYYSGAQPHFPPKTLSGTLIVCSALCWLPSLRSGLWHGGQ